MKLDNMILLTFIAILLLLSDGSKTTKIMDIPKIELYEKDLIDRVILEISKYYEIDSRDFKFRVSEKLSKDEYGKIKDLNDISTVFISGENKYNKGDIVDILAIYNQKNDIFEKININLVEDNRIINIIE